MLSFHHWGVCPFSRVKRLLIKEKEELLVIWTSKGRGPQSEEEAGGDRSLPLALQISLFKVKYRTFHSTALCLIKYTNTVQIILNVQPLKPDINPAKSICQDYNFTKLAAISCCTECLLRNLLPRAVRKG